MIFAIGDVHGRYDLLVKAFDHIETNYNLVEGRDHIIMLGDYVDRGPESRQVIEFLMDRPDVICLKGNHEDMMAYVHRDFNVANIKAWFKNGGMATMRSYGAEINTETKKVVFNPYLVPESHIEWLENLPTRAESENFIFVHAGIMPWTELDENDDDTVMWIRDEFLYADAIAFPKKIVHGHTPLCAGKNLREPEVLPHRVNLDTGACFTGFLAIGIFKDEDPDFVETVIIKSDYEWEHTDEEEEVA